MVFSNVSDVNREKTSTGETETAEDFNASNGLTNIPCWILMGPNLLILAGLSLMNIQSVWARPNLDLD